MKQYNDKVEFSFYFLLLLSFLKESHPELAERQTFIRGRAAQASEAYAEAFDNGLDIQECRAVANNVLYAGLHFSRHDTIVGILWNEFNGSVSIDDSFACAIRLRPLLNPIFRKYTLTDDFVYSPEYQGLYTELVGAIQQKVEDDGCL